LFNKLEKYGIKGDLHKWLTSFLTKIEMRVVTEGEQSNKAVVESGVPQGTVLGLLLFLCHINDLPECVKSQVRLFTDDFEVATHKSKCRVGLIGSPRNMF
jgi:hypothetical protein